MKIEKIFKTIPELSNVLINDFSLFSAEDGIEYSIDKQSTQRLKTKLNNNITVELTIPNNIFEWFVDVFDNHNVKLISDWYDGYGEKKEILIKERQLEIESFIQNITNNKIRFIQNKKGFKHTSLFQYEMNGLWIDLIKHSKFKLF